MTTHQSTALASVDLGFYTYSRQHFKLSHYAPESDGRERPLGIIGTIKLREYLPVGKEISIRTEKADSFGRWLADVDYGSNPKDHTAFNLRPPGRI